MKEIICENCKTTLCEVDETKPFTIRVKCHMCWQITTIEQSQLMGFKKHEKSL